MKSKKRFITSSIVILLLAGTGVYFYMHKKPKAQNKLAPTLVKVSSVSVKNIPLTVSASGTLVANQQTDISSKVSGYITKILFNEGDYVKTNDPLIKLDNTTQEEDLLSAKAAYDESVTKYNRYQKLISLHVYSANAIDEPLATKEANKATYEKAKTALANTTLVAPFSGYLTAKNISVGGYVQIGQKLVTIIDTNHLKIQYSVPASYATRLQLGQEVEVTVAGLNSTFHAKVSYIAPNIDASTQTIDVHALINNEKHVLRSGEFVTVSQNLGTQANAILIPENTVFASINGYHVYQVGLGKKVIATDVTLGNHIGNDVQVTHGLKKNSNIITTGQDQVKSGSIVNVVK